MRGILLYIITITFFLNALNNCIYRNITHHGWYQKYNITNQNDLSKKESIPKLIAALNDNDFYIRRLAIHYLQLLGKDAVIAGPALVKCLEDENIEVRIRATEAFLKIPYMTPKIIKDVSINLISGRTPSLRRISAKLLGTLNYSDELAMKSLIHASTSDNHPNVRMEASKSYGLINIKSLQYSDIQKKTNIKSDSQISELYIGITDLEAINVQKNIADALVSRLYVELFESQYFNVLERKKMEEILKEQGFQLSGCTETECIVELGKLLNVQQMLTGSIAKVGNIFNLNLRLIDIETGKLTSSAIEDIEGNIEQVLTNGVQNSVNKLIANYKQ